VNYYLDRGPNIVGPCATRGKGKKRGGIKKERGKNVWKTGNHQRGYKILNEQFSWIASFGGKDWKKRGEKEKKRHHVGVTVGWAPFKKTNIFFFFSYGREVEKKKKKKKKTLGGKKKKGETRSTGGDSYGWVILH